MFISAMYEIKRLQYSILITDIVLISLLNSLFIKYYYQLGKICLKGAA